MRSILGASLDDQERLTLFEELCEELKAHAAAEEQTLYAELLAHSQQQIQQSVADNDEIVDLILQLQDLDIASADWLARFEVLKEKVERHLETEETLVFPLARTQIKRRRAKVLGERFEQLKQRELSIWGRQARKRRVMPDRRLVTARRLEREPTPAK